MSTTTTTGTLAAGSSKTFTLAPGGAVSLTLSPNVRVTITETPESVSGSGVGGNTSRVHEPQLPGTFAYGPYAMGGVVVVAVASNSGSSVAWTRKDTVVTTSSDGTSLVSGDRNWLLASAPGKEVPKVIWYGDSYGMRSNAANAISAATVSGGVMTITTSSAHGLGPGMPVSLVGPASELCRFVNAPAITASGSTLTVAVPGAPSGTVAISDAARGSMYLVKCERFIEEGTFIHLQRRSGYAFEMLRNLSQQGHTVAELAALYATLVTPYESGADLIVFEAGYNSIATSEALATVLAAYATIIATATRQLFIITPWPVASGSSADSAAKLQLALSYYWGLKALCAANPTRVTLVDIFEGMVTPSTGYVQTGYMGADGVHKSCRGSDYVAQQMLLRMPSEFRPARTSVASALDNVATDAANANIARNGLGTTTTGGTNSGFTAAAPGDETTGTGAVMANFTASATSVTGNVFWKPATVGNAQCLRIVADATTDQGRLSFGLTTSDIVLGGKLDILFKFKLRTDFNGSAKTPAGQNVRYVTMQLVLTIDGVTYTTEFSNFGVSPTAGVYVLSDIDSAIAATGLVVPAGAACTLARLDCICSFDGAGSAQMEMSQVSVRKVT